MNDGAARRTGARLRVGALALVLAPVQYLLAQLVAAAAWQPPYRWGADFISDLGNTACGPFAVPHGTPAYVCSPLHAVMNASFVASGLLLIAAVALLWPLRPSGGVGTVGAVLLVLSGLGKILTGLVPENTVISLHLLGALNVPFGGLAVLLVSVGFRRRYRRLAAIGAVLSLVGLVGSVLSSAAQVAGPILLLGLGVGGMERVAGYPVNVWMLVSGVLLLGQQRRWAAGRTDPTVPGGLRLHHERRRADVERA